MKCKMWRITVIPVWQHMVTKHPGDHVKMYGNIKSLHCITGTNTVLYRSIILQQTN